LIEWEQLSLADVAMIKSKSEQSFLNFTRLWFELLQGDRLLVNWHHRMMASAIDDMIARRVDVRNLIVNIPPGGTKTEFFSIHLPAYVNALVSAGKLKRFRNLNLSYADSLVRRNSRRTRDIISSPEYQALWPCQFATNQAEEWQIVDDRGRVVGETVSKSIGGQVTGGRGGFIGKEFSGLVAQDDPDKPRDMFSSVKRDAAHQIQVNTIRSRRGDKSKDNYTPILVVQQRLHVDDTSGFLLNGGMGVPFNLLKIPALLSEEYIESLPEPHRSNCWLSVRDSDVVENAGVKYRSFWPENEYVGQLFDLWERDEYTFMSQYMQDPISLSGCIFQSDWFRWYGDEDNPAPYAFEYRFITADTATKTKTYNDFSVICEWGVCKGNLYLIEMTRGKWEAPELEAVFSAVIEEAAGRNADATMGNLRDILVEDKASGTGLIQTVGRYSPVPITAVQRNIDKLTRAMDTAPHLKAGKVHIPTGKRWAVEFVAEHAQFSADNSHKHDDMVDNTCDAVAHAIISGGGLFDMFI